MNKIREIIQYRSEIDTAVSNLLLYSILAMIVTIIKGIVVKHLSWYIFLIVEFFYLVGLSCGFLLAVSIIIPPLLKIIYAPVKDD